MDIYTLTNRLVSFGLIIGVALSCTTTPSEKQETTAPVDSTCADTGVVNAEDTTVLYYPTENETFVDEGGESQSNKEEVNIEE